MRCGRALGASLDMDTPDRSQIGTPISKFEDSPVFNYINSLSPIQPVKSLHTTQTFNSLSFASLPSVFTSPHVSSNKESRFLRRHQFVETSRTEFSCGDGSKVGTNAEAVDATQLCDDAAEQLKHFDAKGSIRVPSGEPLNESSKLAIELPQTYDCRSPDRHLTSYRGIEADSVLELDVTSASLIPCNQDVSVNTSFQVDALQQGTCLIEQKKEEAGCDWESLLSDTTELLIFDSPIEPEDFKGLIQKSQDHGETISSSILSHFLQDDADDLQNAQLVGPIDSSEQHTTEDPSTQPGEASELRDIDQTLEEFANTSLGKCLARNLSEKMDDEPVSNLHRGMRRRCLVFEMGGGHRKNLKNSSGYSSSMLSQSDEEMGTIDKQLIPCKPGGDSSRRILPGIGLHLNALAVTPKQKLVKHETLASGRQLNMPSPTASIHSPTSGEESLNKLLPSTSSERDTNLIINEVQVGEDASQASAYIASEEFNQSSPKKKKRRLEIAGENEACKRCNCKKSKCLKLYCECFAAGVYCIEPCSCQDCFNKPLHEDTVLATRKQIETRNPLAFAPKVIRNSDSVPDIGEESSQTPASARHKRGCNCKKSSCLKKYCECFQGGVGCSINCRCEGCKNAFGRKDGSSLIGIEAEPDEEETEKFEKNVLDKSTQKPQIRNNEEQNPDSTLPATPLHLSRVSVKLPFSSKSKLHRSSFLTVGSSSGLPNIQRLGRTNFLRPHPKLEKNFQTVPENDDNMPAILRSNCSPISNIKSASPNSKRVSPPHCDFGSSSPGLRSSRKLILQSIPSFPSLTQP